MPLRPATKDELLDSLSFALHYDGRRRHTHNSTFLARAGAEILIKYLEDSGFVVMKKEPRPEMPYPYGAAYRSRLTD